MKKVEIKSKSMPATKAKTMPALNILSFNGKSYRRIDLENEWTIRQKKIAVPIANEILNRIKSLMSAELLKSQDDVIEITSPEGVKKTIQKNQFQEAMRLNFDVSDFEFESQLLALLYIEENEERFTFDTYEQRIEEFNDLPECIYENARSAITNFFDTKLKTMLTSSQTYLAQTMQAAELR